LRFASIMARIRITLDGDCLCVHIAGRLTATDLRRLEHACSPAPTTDRVRIELDVARVTAMDSAAAAFVSRMTERGATIAERCLAPTATRGLQTPASTVATLENRQSLPLRPLAIDADDRREPRAPRAWAPQASRITRADPRSR
jgi:hypothetical protein